MVHLNPEAIAYMQKYNHKDILLSIEKITKTLPILTAESSFKKKEDLLADGYVCERSPLGNVYYRSDGVIATGDISVNYVTYPWLTCFEVDGLTIKNQTSI